MELIVIVVAIALGSFFKGATGTGLPQIAIPVMAIFVGVERSVVIMALPGVVANAWLVWSNRSALPQSRDLRSLVATGIVGAIAGTVALKTLDGRLLSISIAVIIIGYVVVSLVHPDLRFSRA